MNKHDLIKGLAQFAKLSNKDVEKIVDALVVTITKSLKKGEQVKLIGFGTFKVVKTKARIGRNPKTGKELKISSRKRARFVPGAKLKKAVA